MNEILLLSVHVQVFMECGQVGVNSTWIYIVNTFILIKMALTCCLNTQKHNIQHYVENHKVIT